MQGHNWKLAVLLGATLGLMSTVPNAAIAQSDTDISRQKPQGVAQSDTDISRQRPQGMKDVDESRQQPQGLKECEVTRAC